ncbi:MAG: RidA family protein [Burkholderiales bacterium]|nr:RidA family protein [Burkholderiales bacterium]
MTGRIAQRLAQLGITLPTPAAPGGSYVPFVTVGDIVYLAGQVARSDGKMQYVGKVGRELTVEQGQAAARICALNLLAQLEVACEGDLDRVVRCVRLNGYVSCGAEFTEQPRVIDGASNLIVDVFGESGKHARTAVGVASLPRDSATEVEAIFMRSR